MRARCENEAHPNFTQYGGRGITVCERWASFENFLADMGPRPSRNHSIDRIDNDGNYEPGNCRWATKLEQSSNRRTSRLFQIAGEKLSLTEAARKYNINEATLYARVARGIPISIAVSTPPHDCGRRAWRS